jgi:hypothetical protein
MQFSQQFRGFGDSWKNCLHSVRQGRAFLIFFLYAAAQLSVLFMLMNYAYEPFSPFLVPLIERAYGESALHYPNNFLALPSLFNWASIILSGFVGVSVVATATGLFASIYKEKQLQLGRSFKQSLPKYFILLVVWLIETMVLLAVFALIPQVMLKLQVYSNLVLHGATFAVSVFFGGLFAYTTANIILAQEGILPAIRKSFSLFIKSPLVTMLLIAIPNLLRFPLDFLSGKPLLIIDKFNPEIVGVVIGLSILVSVFSNYFMIGTITRFFLIAKEQRVI